MLRFTVPGDPRSKGRARSRVLGRATTGRAIVQHYVDADTAEYVHRVARAVRSAAAAAGVAVPIAGPVRVDVLAVFPRLARAPRSQPGRTWHVARPDRDNIDKAVLDGIVASGVLADDASVCWGEVAKVRAALGEAPGAHVRLVALADSPDAAGVPERF